MTLTWGYVQFAKVRGHLQLYHAYIHESSPPTDQQEPERPVEEAGWEVVEGGEGENIPDGAEGGSEVGPPPVRCCLPAGRRNRMPTDGLTT